MDDNTNEHKETKKDIKRYFVNVMAGGHFINPSEFFTVPLKTSPISPF